MVAMSPAPIEDVTFATKCFSIFSTRVGAEMERIKNEAGLKEREEHFRTLFELTPNFMTILNEQMGYY